MTFQVDYATTGNNKSSVLYDSTITYTPPNLVDFGGFIIDPSTINVFFLRCI